MGFQQYIKKTLFTLSNMILKPLRSNECIDLQSVISSLKATPSLFEQIKLNLLSMSAINSNKMHISCGLSMLSQDPANLARFELRGMSSLSEFIFKSQRLDSIHAVSSSSLGLLNSNCEKNSTVSTLFEKESIDFKDTFRKSVSLTQYSDYSTVVFQCSPLQKRTLQQAITNRRRFQRQRIHSMQCRLKHTKPKVPPTKISQVYDYEGAITDERAAQEFVFALKTSERQHLFAELAKYQGLNHNGLQTTPPTRKQLQQVVLHQTFPFLGFGFLDNLLMIVAGEYIDATLGATLGISTMAAAALGNLISDVGGLGSAHYVETLAARVGIRNPHLSPEQVEMRRTKWASNLGKFIGVTLGCLLGMFPLLFYNEKKTDRKHEEDSEASGKKEDKAKEKIVDSKNV